MQFNLVSVKFQGKRTTVSSLQYILAVIKNLSVL